MGRSIKQKSVLLEDNITTKKTQMNTSLMTYLKNVSKH